MQMVQVSVQSIYCAHRLTLLPNVDSNHFIGRGEEGPGNKQRPLGEEIQRASFCSDRQLGGGVLPIQIEGRWEEECAAPIDELKIV